MESEVDWRVVTGIRSGLEGCEWNQKWIRGL